MDRSRSPRNLSDEARLLQRLVEVELPPGASDAECAATRAEAAAAVQHAASEWGAVAYRELARMQLYITIRPAVTATGGGTMFSETFEARFSDIDLEVVWVEQPEDKAKVVDVCRRVLAGFEVTGTFAGER